MDANDASTSAHEIISADKIIKNDISIRNIHLDDLTYLERDLDFGEKVTFASLNNILSGSVAQSILSTDD